VRSEAKLVVRLTICVVLSYLWQHCVLETTQQVGTDFPTAQCDLGADCFASTLHFTTLFTRDYEAIDCTLKQEFASRHVVSCIRFIPPTASSWMMHLAISHSVTQLNFKSYEVMVWIGGNSKWCRRLLCGLIIITFSLFIGLFFGGVMSEFVSSWLSFVMSLTIPLFLHTVYGSAKSLQKLWTEEAVKVQQQIEEHLSGAFTDIETAINLDSEPRNASETTPIITSPSHGLAAAKAEEGSKQKEGRKVISTLRSMTSSMTNSARNARNLNHVRSNDPKSKAPSPPKQEPKGSSPKGLAAQSSNDEPWLSADLAAALAGEASNGKSGKNNTSADEL